MPPEAKGTESLDAGHWFAQAWAAALGDVVEALNLGGGEPLEVRAGAADAAKWSGWSEPLWHAQSWPPAQGAQLWLGCASAVPKALWANIRGGEGGDSDGQALETFREILNQAAAGAATEVASRLGVTMQPSPLTKDTVPSPGWAVELHFEADGQACTIALAGNGALAGALNPAEMPGAPPGPAARKPAAAPANDPLEMIREVNLELAVSFGDTIMPLGEVLRLSSGAIIELDRSVSDPVEVLVNDSVIARGEVVVVDGNYGVRITEIVSRRARVRTML